MSEKDKKQFGVWMDAHHATIVGREDLQSGDFVILGHEKMDGQGSNSSENASNNAERDSLQKLFKSITAHMQNVDQLHITGTGTAQEQFMKYMNDTAQYKNVEMKISKSNKMSDEALVEFVTAEFN